MPMKLFKVFDIVILWHYTLSPDSHLMQKFVTTCCPNCRFFSFAHPTNIKTGQCDHVAMHFKTFLTRTHHSLIKNSHDHQSSFNYFITSSFHLFFQSTYNFVQPIVLRCHTQKQHPALCRCLCLELQLVHRLL